MINRVQYWKNISRDDLKNNPDKIFLFGDNLIHKGLGGQAKVMRGEKNAIGIPTKKYPSMHDTSFFSDDEFHLNRFHIDRAFDSIPKGVVVVIPLSGLGTGLAELPFRAPMTYNYLLDKIKEL